MVIANLSNLIESVENDLANHQRTPEEVFISKVQQRLDKALLAYMDETDLSVSYIKRCKDTYVMKKINSKL